MTVALDSALRRLIVEQAEAAALRIIAGEAVSNPYPPDGDAAACWNAALERFLQKHSVPGADGGA